MGLSKNQDGVSRGGARGGTAQFAGDRQARHDSCAGLARYHPPANPNDPFFLHIATPAGKSGYVDGQSISPLGGDQICYTKQGGAWKIAGYLGGAVQQ
jgi:hypothetical protein